MAGVWSAAVRSDCTCNHGNPPALTDVLRWVKECWNLELMSVLVEASAIPASNLHSASSALSLLDYKLLR